MKKQHIKFYKQCMETGILPEDQWGLCNCAYEDLINPDLLDNLSPTIEDCQQLINENLSTTYWGSGLSVGDNKRYSRFTPLRQTIVLFMAALNKEL